MVSRGRPFASCTANDDPVPFGVICFIIVATLFAAAYLFGASIIGVLEREKEGIFPEGETGAATEETPGGD